MKVPATMKAVRQDTAGGKLYIDRIPVPQPAKGEVLVKMAASPINPSDLSALQGTYVGKPIYPLTPGIEGSGMVVSSGGGVLANMRVGKRVTCSSSEGNGGTWAEYMVTSAMRVIPLSKEVDMEQGAMLIVNPMTALAFINIAKEGKHKSIVNNAAASVLGQMLIRLCDRENIDLINIVRREEQVQLLKSLGAKHVLNSSDINFEENLSSLSKKLDASLFFDAVAGTDTQKLVDNSPYGSKIVLYANLSNSNMEISPRSLIQNARTISSFYLGGWSKSRSILQSLSAAKKVQKLVKTDLSSTIQKRFSLNEAQEAWDFYLENMTGGKTLLKIE